MNLLETTNVTLQNVSSDNQLSESMGLVSEEVLKVFLNYASMLSLFLAAVCLVACFLNIAVNCKQRRDACTYYLLAMSIGDGIYLCCSILSSIGGHIWGETTHEISVINLYLNLLPTTISRNSAIVLNSLASLERFLVLVFPFKVSANLLNRFPRAVIVFVFGFTVLGHVSLALEFRITEVQPNTWSATSTKLRLDNYQLFLFLRNFSRMIFFYIPLMFSLVMNISLVVALRYHACNQKNIRAIKGKGNNTGKNRQFSRKNTSFQEISRTSRLILILTFSFFLLALPRAINATATSFVRDYGYGTRNNALTLIVGSIADFSAYLTELSIFIVSNTLSSQFRKLLCCLLRLDRCFTLNNLNKKNVIAVNSTMSRTNDLSSAY